MMKSSLKKFAISIFHFLSSLKLAVVTLLSLAAVLAAGTVYESLYDAATARHYIYGTAWFVALLCFLGLNVLCAALSRWPWKKHHTGFVITHLGIILILLGSLVTLIKGYEGQVIFEEGETARRMTIEVPQLFFYDPQYKKLEEIPVEFRFDPPDLAHPFAGKVLGDVLIKVDDYIPHALQEEKVSAGEGLENPALQIQLQGSRATLKEWIFAREMDRQRLSLGPASVNYLEVPDRQAFRDILNDPEKFHGAFLYFGKRWIPVQDPLDKEVAQGLYILRLDEYLPNAGVTDEGLSNLGPEPVNPAVRLTLKAGKKEQHFTLFSRFPQLPAMHDVQDKPLVNLRLWFFPDQWGSQPNELVLAKTPEGKLYYAIRAHGSWSDVRELQSEAPVDTGWMDFKFAVVQNLSVAKVEKKFRKVPVPQGQEGPPPAIRLHLANQQETKDIWLGRGEEKSLTLGDRPLSVAYGLKSKPLGFEIKLNDFIMGLNEGTQDPASFESRVTLMDPEHLEKSDHRIAMNEPLKYGKYKVFQASYQLNPGGKDWSILAVAYDPGINLKYVGALTMIFGILTMFFLKPLFIQKKLAQRKPQQGESKSEFRSQISSSM